LVAESGMVMVPTHSSFEIDYAKFSNQPLCSLLQHHQGFVYKAKQTGWKHLK